MSRPGGVSAYPINLDAQLKWHASFFTAPAPHPAPLVVARLASPSEISSASRTAGAMRSFAWRHGWRANVTYAKGTLVGAYGRPGRVVESLALRMRYGKADEIGAVGVWHSKPGGGWGLDMARVWPTAGDAFPFIVTADELKFVITHASLVIDEPDSWRWRSMARLIDEYRQEVAAEKARKAA